MTSSSSSSCHTHTTSINNTTTNQVERKSHARRTNAARKHEWGGRCGGGGCFAQERAPDSQSVGQTDRQKDRQIACTGTTTIPCTVGYRCAALVLVLAVVIVAGDRGGGTIILSSFNYFVLHFFFTVRPLLGMAAKHVHANGALMCT